jgi:hypothetical protein
VTLYVLLLVCGLLEPPQPAITAQRANNPNTRKLFLFLRVTPPMIKPGNSNAVAPGGVVMVSVEVCTVSVPSACTVVGEKLQAWFAGSPEQLKVTWPVKPPAGVTVKVIGDEPLTGTLSAAGLAEIVKPEATV